MFGILVVILVMYLWYLLVVYGGYTKIHYRISPLVCSKEKNVLSYKEGIIRPRYHAKLQAHGLKFVA